MIILSFSLWVCAFFFIIKKAHTLSNDLTIGVLSILASIAFTSYSYTAVLFLGIPFDKYQLVFTLLPTFPLFLYREAIATFLSNNKKSTRSISTSSVIVVFSCILIFSFRFFLHSKRWGEWDSWAIWSLHAKFLTFDSDFSNLFTNDIGWTHPDYPLMLPSIIAVFWKSIGQISPLIPLIIDYITGLSLLIIVYASLYDIKFPIKSIFALIILACTNIAFPYVHIQYADTLLAIFILVPFVLLNKSMQLKEGQLFVQFAVGFFAASCGWIKNEGVAFFFVFSSFLLIVNHNNIKGLSFYLLGAILPLTILLIFKLYFAPSNDLLLNQESNFLHKLIDTSRYYMILKYFFIDVLIFRYYLLSIFLILSFIILKSYKFLAFKVSLSLIIVYLFVYVLTPHDLFWHLDSSFNRLIHHIMPVLLYSMLNNLDSIPFLKQNLVNNQFID